jgi:hypothetical protein
MIESTTEVLVGRPMTTTTKKTLRVPVAADGVPLVVQSQRAERTREIAAGEPLDPEGESPDGASASAPREVVPEEITVPVNASIESSLNYELLRRQSTKDDDGDKQR